MLDGSHIDPVFSRQADGGDLDSGVLQLLFQERSGLRGAFPLKMAGIADFNLVVVDVQVDQTGRLAAKDDFVVTGMFQLGSEKPAK